MLFKSFLSFPFFCSPFVLISHLNLHVGLSNPLRWLNHFLKLNFAGYFAFCWSSLSFYCSLSPLLHRLYSNFLSIFVLQIFFFSAKIRYELSLECVPVELIIPFFFVDGTASFDVAVICVFADRMSKISLYYYRSSYSLVTIYGFHALENCAKIRNWKGPQKIT